MHIINAEFERIDTVRLPMILEGRARTGIYCIWSGRAQYKPSYIGEGAVFDRLFSHVAARAFARPIDGYVAFLEAGGAVRNKVNAEIVEALLLAVAGSIDKWPSRNFHPGKRGRIFRIFRNHGALRVNVHGFDPFLHPGTAKRLDQPRRISVYAAATDNTRLAPFKDEFGAFWWRHSWRLRRRSPRGSNTWWPF